MLTVTQSHPCLSCAGSSLEHACAPIIDILYNVLYSVRVPILVHIYDQNGLCHKSTKGALWSHPLRGKTGQ